MIPLPGNINLNGYVTYNMRGDDDRKGNQYAHRLVALAFLGKPPTVRHYACHKNGDPADNRVRNIRWGLPTENSADMKRHGRHSNGTTKLTPKQVREIRSSYRNGKTTRAIAKSYGMKSHATIVRLVNHKSWKDGQWTA